MNFNLHLLHSTDFIRDFLKRLGEIEACDKTSHICSQSYNQTLANFHPFLIRKAAGLAMYALPSKPLNYRKKFIILSQNFQLTARDQLFEKVCSDIPKSIEALPEMLRITDLVYKRIDQLYTIHNLHGLP
jgi:hypothetical protein